MTATSEHLEAFALLTWATPYLTSPNWIACDRQRVTEKGEDTDRFCRDTMRANNGVRYWLELYEKPAPGAKVTKSISLIKYGTGLNGFPGICHGGALLTLMDEAMLHILVANTVLENGLGFMKVGEDYWRLQLHDGKSAQEVLMGRLATATMDVKLLAPVLCPGVVGIETEVLEDSHQDEDESYDEGSTGQAVTQSGRTVGQDSRCSKTITAGSNLVPNVPRESDTLLR